MSQPEQPRTSPNAIWSLVLGILAIPTCVLAIPGVITGIIALVNIGRHRGEYSGKPLAITGIVISSLSMVVTSVVSIQRIHNQVWEGVESMYVEMQIAVVVREVHLWANEHDGNLPGDLQTLVDNGSISQETLTNWSPRFTSDEPLTLELLIQGNLDDYSLDTPMIRTSRPLDLNSQQVWFIAYAGGQIKQVPVEEGVEAEQ